MTRAPADKRLTFSMTETDTALLPHIQEQVGLLNASGAIRYALKQCAAQIDAEAETKRPKHKQR